MSVLVTVRRPDAPAPSSPALRLLTGLALDLAARESLWTPLVRFDPERRVVLPLAGPPGVGAWLSTWLPGQGSDVHDHGSTAAALVVVEGVLAERLAGTGGQAVAQRLHRGAVATLAPGARHVLANDGPRPAVSIHVRTAA